MASRKRFPTKEQTRTAGIYKMVGLVLLTLVANHALSQERPTPERHFEVYKGRYFHGWVSCPVDWVAGIANRQHIEAAKDLGIQEIVKRWKAADAVCRHETDDEGRDDLYAMQHYTFSQTAHDDAVWVTFAHSQK